LRGPAQERAAFRRSRIITRMSRRSRKAAFRFVLLLGLLAGVTLDTSAQTASIPADAGARTLASLEGRWDLLLDPEDRGSARGLPTGDSPAWSDAFKIFVPGVLEATSQTMGYDGVAWYRTVLPALVSPPADRGRLLLEFAAVNWRADVWLDGTLLGRHDGGDAPFRFDVTGRLERAGAVLVVRCVDPGSRPVDGLVLAGLPNAAESTDYNWGGITGSVRVVAVPLVELRRHDGQLLADGSAQLRLDLVNHSAAPRSVQLQVQAERAGEPAGSADAAGTDAGAPAQAAAPLLWSQSALLPPGETRLIVPMPGAGELTHWSPSRPVAHALSVAVDDAGQVTHWQRRIALRRFAIEGDRFTLDGQPLPLHGVLYPPCFPRGLAQPPDGDFLRRDLSAIRAAGFNLVRVHARTQPDVYALCDELGLLVCAEPSLGIVTHELPETGPAAASAVSALADAVAGHPSVVMADLLDELSGDLWRRAGELVAVARERMPERLLIDESGGWQGAAHAWNPHAAEPVAIDDVHLPREGVPSAALRERVARLGSGHERLVWVSAWGVSGTPASMDTVSGFAGRLQSEDAREYTARLELVAGQLQAGAPLADLVPDAAQLTALGAAAQARGVGDLGRLLRGNPRLAGDCFAQWRDAAWQDAAGLCTVWGAPKPALAALAALNAPPAAGAADRTALPPLPERPARPIAAGALVSLGADVSAVVSGLVDTRPESFGGLPRLVVLGERPSPWSAANLNVTLSMLRFVRDGGTLLWLSPPDAGRPMPQQFSASDGCGQIADLPFDIASRRTRGAGAETFLAFAPNSLLLSDIPGAQTLPDERFLALQPARVLLAGHGVPVDVQCGAIAADGSFAGGALQAIGYGKGHFVLSTLPFDGQTLADPLARRVLENVVRYAAGIAGRKPPPPAATDAAPPAESVGAITRMVWRAQVYFGLAERLALQELPGRPIPRDELPELGVMVARKSTGLDLVIAGRSTDGLAVLAMLDEASLGDDRERFLRAEVALSDTLERRRTEDPPLAPPLRHAVERLHARALRLMRLGQTGGALDQLSMATTVIAAPITTSAPDEAATSGAGAAGPATQDAGRPAGPDAGAAAEPPSTAPGRTPVAAPEQAPVSESGRADRAPAAPAPLVPPKGER